MKNKLLYFLLFFLLTFTAFAKRDKVFDFSAKGPQIFSYERLSDGTVRLMSHIPKILGMSSTNVLAEWYAGYTSAGDLLDISGNSRDLTDSAGPIIVDSTVLSHNGTGLKAFSYDGTSYHSRAHEAWMDMFSSNFTVTMLIKHPSTAPVTTTALLCHGSNTVSGTNVSMTNDGRMGMNLSKAGLDVAAYASMTYDGLYHMYTFVRNNDFLTVYLDGVAGAPVSVSGYGIAGSRTFYLARYDTAGLLWWNSHIAYTRLQNTALTYSQIQKEVSLFQGVLASRSTAKYLIPTFQRPTTSYVDRKTGTNPLAQVPANVPVITPDSGILVQETVSQILVYTETFSNANWTKSNTSIAATSLTLPNGSTSTANTLHEDGTAGTTHYLSQTYSAVSGTKYCLSFYVKYNSSAGTPREWIKLYLGDGISANTIYFNIRRGSVGTASSVLTGGYGIQPLNSDWFRVYIWITSAQTRAAGTRIQIAEYDNDDTFDGKDQDSVYVAFPQLETGSFPTTYVPRLTDTAASRSADNLTFIPWRVNKNLSSKVNSTPRLLFMGNESLNGTTVTPNTGSYTFTKNGRPQNGQTESEGNFFSFNGSTDYLSLADDSGGSDFDPSGDFSVVISFTPTSVSAGKYLVNKWNVTGDKRGWLLYHQNGSIIFYRSTDGTAANSAFAIVNVSAQTGQPSLVTATYSTTNGLVLRVDNITSGTNAANGTVYNTNASLTVGSGIIDTTPSNYFSGGIHYLAYYDNYIVSQAEHDAMYASFKQDGFLPLTVSSTKPKKKLTVEFDAKCLFGSSTTIGSDRILLDVGGIVGVSSTTKNRVTMYVNSSGVLVSGVYDSTGGTLRNMYSGANNVTYNRWNTYKTMFNFSDLANSTLIVNGVSEKDNTSNLTGAQEIKFHDSLIRFGQSVEAYPNAMCEYKNIRLLVE